MPHIIVFLLSLAGMGASHLLAQPPAFPGAEGFGAYATGGRGGDVSIVTNPSAAPEGGAFSEC